jgi:hypothetical protein
MMPFRSLVRSFGGGPHTARAIRYFVEAEQVFDRIYMLRGMKA